MIRGTKGKTLSNFFSVSILQAGNYVLPMVTLPIISRIIGPENYGLINYTYAFVGYFVLLVNAGFDLYGTTMIVKDNSKEALSVLFSKITGAKMVLLIVSFIVFFFIAFFIPQLRTQKVLCMFTFLSCIGWVINPAWLYTGMQDSKRYSVFSFSTKLLFSVLLVLLIKRRDDYLFHPLIVNGTHIFVSFVSCLYAIKKYSLSITGCKWAEIKATLTGNGKLSLINIFGNQAVSTNIVFAGLVLSSKSLGYFSASFKLIFIIQSIVFIPLNLVLFPFVGEAFVQNFHRGIDRFHKIFPYVISVVVLSAVFVFVFSKWIILSFYGNEFYNAIAVLKVLSVGLIFTTVNSVLGMQILLNIDRETDYLKFIVSGILLNVALLFLFHFANQTIGVAFAWPISEFAITVGYLFYFRRAKVRIANSKYHTPGFLYFNLIGGLTTNLARFKRTSTN